MLCNLSMVTELGKGSITSSHGCHQPQTHFENQAPLTFSSPWPSRSLLVSRQLSSLQTFLELAG